VHSPNTRGWQSVKFSEYPQELGFAIDGSDVRLSQVQILSHQSKIASKIEIFIGQGATYQTAQFKRLGYLSLDSNERSQYQARELKTVYIDYAGSFVRLIIHRNYVNKQNLFNQVGLVAVNLLGSESGGAAASNSLQQNVPTFGPGAGNGSSNNALNDLSIDMNLDPQTANKLRLLSDSKANAIATEDYLTAKQIKSVEGELKQLGSRLAQLDMAKRQAVGAEDYDRAKEIKDETDELRSDIERKILAIHIPGVTDNYPQVVESQYRAAPIQDERSIPVQRDRTPERVQKPRFAPSKEDGDEDPFESIDTSPASNVAWRGQQPKGVPMNIDDIPVGAGAKGMGSSGGMGGSGGIDNEMSARKKTSENAAVRHRDYEHGGIASKPEEYLPNGDRAIKPKNNAFYDDADVNNPNGNNEPIPDRFKKDEVFEPGSHPLEGVPNLSDLPSPDDLMGKAKDVSDQNGVTSLCGDYIARCLFSKTWALREAAITKIHMNLESDYEETPGITSCINALATVIRVGVEDKIQQVLFNAVALLDDVLGCTRRAKMGRSVLAPILDPITADLVDKLSDGNARIREGARRGCEILAASANIGPAVVGAHALRSMSSKQKTAWRPVVARLEVLTGLISQYGLGNSSGIMVDNVMNFAKSNGCFTHSNGEVRIATQELTVAVQKIVGTEAIGSYLRLLRPKQLEEYENAFGGGLANKLNQDSLPAASSKRGGGNSSRTGGGAKESKDPNSPRSAAKRLEKHHSPQKKADQEETQDFTTCMFCGEQNGGWDEDALDMHYWKECALLAPCPACAQVVEVAGMADHLLDECEHKLKYVSCQTTGLAVPKATLKEWQTSPECKPCPTGEIYCPLCKLTVDNTDDAWRNHLYTECQENARSHQGKR
jgi:centrosomal protein CEP104